MELLTKLAATSGDIDETSCMSYGGLVDRCTAAADDVLLWTDPATVEVIMAASTQLRLQAVA